MEYKWTVLSNTTLGGLLASIDGSILLIALPVVFRGLGVNPFEASNFPILLWLLLGYGVVTATLLVTVGRLSDMLGRARMYNFGFAIFSTGSILLFVEPWSGATGAWALVVFRSCRRWVRPSCSRTPSRCSPTRFHPVSAERRSASTRSRSSVARCSASWSAARWPRSPTSTSVRSSYRPGA